MLHNIPYANRRCRRQIEKSPLAQIEMSLSTVLVGEFWADDGDYDEPDGDRPDERVAGSGGEQAQSNGSRDADARLSTHAISSVLALHRHTRGRPALPRPCVSPADESRHLGLATPHRLAHLEALELRVFKIERLVVTGLVMRRPEGLGLGPRLKDGMVLPDGVGGIKRVVLRLGPLEKRELEEAWYLVEMTVARHPDLLESCLRALGDAKAVHCDIHYAVSCARWPAVDAIAIS